MSAHLSPDQLWQAALGELDPAARAELDAHLSGCGECRAALGEARATVSALVVTEPPVPPAQTAHVHARLLASHRRSRSSWALAWAFVVLAWPFAFLDATQHGLAPGLGVECWLIEQLGAALGFGAAWLCVRRWPALDVPRLAALAAGGALLGQAYLHFRCAAAHALEHLLCFHALGVVTAFALAVIVSRTLLPRSLVR